MCGIAGWFDPFHGRRWAQDIADGMAERIRHRGPDSAGQFQDGRAALAARRLKIVDPVGGDQPHVNEDGTIVAVCNGEVFNAPALRTMLLRRGHRFHSRCDTEVLVHLYEEYGVDLVNHLDGQFALAVYDSRVGRLVLARDHFGVAPLFYTRVGGTLAFASEIKAVLAFPGVPRQVDLAGLDQVLSLPGLVSPRTMFQGVSALRPGERLVAEGDQLTASRYWDVDYPVDGQPVWGEAADGSTDADGFADTAADLRRRLTSAVQRRLQADVPVGVYLSGGLDSALLAAVLAREAPGEVHSFGVDVRGAGAMSELRYQQVAARQAGTTHHVVTVGPEELADNLRAVVRHAECPLRESYDGCALLLSRAARAAGVPVVLSGQGADELFGGYPGYRLAGRRAPSPWPGGEVLEREFRQRMWGADVFYEQDQLPLHEIRLWLYTPEVVAELSRCEVTAHRLVEPGQIVGRDPFHQRSYLDLKLRLADHLLGDHGDRMAFANGVEMRVPFLDLDVFDLVSKVPPAWMLHGGREKALLREAATGLVPEEIRSRPKFGFRAPGSSALLATGVEWLHEVVAPSTIQRQGYFSADAVSALLARSRADSAENPHLRSDLLLLVATFSLLVEEFGLPCLG